MRATNLGFFNTSGTRTHVRFQFSTHASAGGNVAPASAFENSDIRIYKAADGAAFSATQRSSAAGITMTSPFDSLTGFHDVDIDLTDNTDAGFYAAGCFYSVVLAPDSETIDSETITGLVLAYFEIGRQQADVREFGGTAGTFSSGRPEVNASHVGGTSQTGADVGSLVAKFTGITRLSHWLGAIMGKQAADATAQTEIRASGAGSGTFDATTDSAEAIRDRGDAAWTTAAGFSTHSAADVWAVGTRALTDKAGFSLATGGVISGAIAAAELNAIADALLDRNMATGTDSGTNSTAVRTVRQALRRLRNKEAISAGTLTVTKEDDATTSWTAGVTTAAGDPLSAVDPT